MSEGDEDKNEKDWDESSKDISNPSTETLAQIRRSFKDKRAQLTIMEQEFARLASIASSNFEQITEKALSMNAQLMRNQWVWIETLLIANFGLKKQVDILKDILVQLREVKGNREMMQDIEKAFKDYNLSNF